MNGRNSQRRFNVLLVEDNEDDVLLTKHAFNKIPLTIDIQVARDGIEALAVLRNAATSAGLILPQIILLDLNMPRMDGRQLLCELKKDEALTVIPAIVLTTSAAECDVNAAYRNHASAYMAKPIDLPEFAQHLASFAGFWLDDVAILPT
ncbi:MAG TPA: response regulator [Lacipirellulaceae bacterium]|nr:response regulator [Lacipirellulaceae bacterium]